MIKFIGIGITLLGLALLAVTIINARRGGASKAAAELSLILEAGYADTHREAKKGARLQEERNVPSEIKIAPKKRTLSKEAQEILAMVEKERAEERSSFEATSSLKRPQKLESGTDLMSRRKKKANEQGSTDILSKNRPSENKPEGTDILVRGGKSTSSAGTDILDRNKAASKDKAAPGGTDILKRGGQEEQKTDVLRKEEKSAGTDILDRKSREKAAGGTDILKRKADEEAPGGTDILQREAVTDTGTGILERRR